MRAMSEKVGIGLSLKEYPEEFEEFGVFCFPFGDGL